MTIKQTVFASMATLAFLAPARAEQLPLVPTTGITMNDFFYLSVGGTYQHIDLPAFAWVYTTPGRQAVNRDLSVHSGGPALTVGYVLDGMPAFMGERVRIEFAGQFLWGTVRSNVASIGSTNAYQEINGLGPVNNPDARNVVTARLESGDVAIRLKSDLSLGNMLTLSPSIGAVAGHTRTFYDDTNIWLSFPNFEDRLLAKIQSTRVGGELGLDATVRVNDALALHVGVTGAAFWQTTRLTIDQCIDSALAAGCQPGALPPGLTNQLRTADTSFGYRAGASLGMTYNWGWAQLTLVGNGAFNGNTPGVGLQPAGAPVGKTARISYDDRWSYGGILMVAFPLN